MKRSCSRLLLPCLLGVALIVSGCSSGSSNDSAGSTTTDSAATPSSAGGSGDSTTTSSASSVDGGPDRLTAVDVQALIDGALAPEPWTASVVLVSEATLLRRPVVSVGLSDGTAVNDALNSLQSALESTGTWGVLEIYEPNYAYFAAFGSYLFEPVELPPSPTSAEGFLPWLNQAFGAASPAPEDWVAHVASVEYASSLPTGLTDVLVVRTDLTVSTDGHRTAQLIVQAIDVARPTFATSYTVFYGDGNYETSGQIVPGFGAFGY